MAALTAEGRVGIYAESGFDTHVAKSFVTERGWTCHRAYRPSEWKQLLDDAATQQFEHIVAIFDGRWWFSPTDPNPRRNPPLPFRAKPPAPKKGGISGTDEEIVKILRPALEEGPKETSALADLLIEAGLTWGQRLSVISALLPALKRTGLRDLYSAKGTPSKVKREHHAKHS
jgi:hypothetical protein